MHYHYIYSDKDDYITSNTGLNIIHIVKSIVDFGSFTKPPVIIRPITNIFTSGYDVNYTRFVIIPVGTKISIFKMGASNLKILTDKIILSDKYYLYNSKIIKKFNLPIGTAYINQVCIEGRVDVLKWLINEGVPLVSYCDTFTLYLTSSIEVLDLLFSLDGLYVDTKYLDHIYMIDNIASSGNIDLIKWWIGTGLSLNYSRVLDSASRGGHIHLLDWWIMNGYPIKYSESAMDFASSGNHINVLEWWKRSGLPVKYSAYALFNAYGCGHIDALEWWLNSNLSLKWLNGTFMYMVYAYRYMKMLQRGFLRCKAIFV
jgi:hypothetical protein